MTKATLRPIKHKKYGYAGWCSGYDIASGTEDLDLISARLRSYLSKHNFCSEMKFSSRKYTCICVYLIKTIF